MKNDCRCVEGKCAHPYCDSDRSFKLVLIPTVYGKQAKFYCNSHEEYGKQLAKEAFDKILNEQRRIFKNPNQAEIKEFSLAKPPIIVKVEGDRVVKQPNGAIKIYRKGNVLPRRQKVYDRDGNKCLACGSTERLTLDHIIPTSLGGSNGEDNLQTLCKKCNGEKGNRIRDYRNTKILIQREPKSFSPK